MEDEDEEESEILFPSFQSVLGPRSNGVIWQ